MRYYNRDIRDVLREPTDLSPRLALSLIDELPMDSSYVAAIQGGAQFRDWGPLEYLVATLIDSVQYNTYATIVAAGPKKKPPLPKPIDRPKREVKQAKTDNPFFQMMQKAKQAAAAREAREAEEAEGGGT